ncbi:MAG: Uma2 family endonuclease [Gemmataceae bacterium]|nr:Uma2 family endonuclease [Gemmataceae bacterium]
MLRAYQEHHPDGKALDKTLPEQTVESKRNRRRADRVLWIGLGRLPRPEDTPSVVVEFVSKGKRGHQRDYEEKRDEYMEMNIGEYWLIDRFEHIMTDFSKQGKRIKKKVIGEKEVYTTPLLPGFELRLARLLSLADEWQKHLEE